MRATNSYSKAAWELLTVFLERPGDNLHRFPRGFRKAIGSSQAALEQFLGKKLRELFFSSIFQEVKQSLLIQSKINYAKKRNFKHQHQDKN